MFIRPFRFTIPSKRHAYFFSNLTGFELNPSVNTDCPRLPLLVNGMANLQQLSDIKNPEDAMRYILNSVCGPLQLNTKGDVNNALNLIREMQHILLMGSWSSRFLANTLQEEVIDEFLKLDCSLQNGEILQSLILSLNDGLFADGPSPRREGSILASDKFDILRECPVDVDLICKIDSRGLEPIHTLYMDQTHKKQHCVPAGIFLQMTGIEGKNSIGGNILKGGIGGLSRSTAGDRSDFKWVFNRVREAAFQFWTDYSVQELHEANVRRARFKLGDRNYVSMREFQKSLANDLDRYLSSICDKLFLLGAHAFKPQLRARRARDSNIIFAAQLPANFSDPKMLPDWTSLQSTGFKPRTSNNKFRHVTKDSRHPSLSWRMNQLQFKPRSVLIKDDLLPSLDEVAKRLSKSPLKCDPWIWLLRQRAGMVEEGRFWAGWSRNSLPEVVLISREVVRSIIMELELRRTGALGRKLQMKRKEELKFKILIVGGGARVLKHHLVKLISAIEKIKESEGEIKLKTNIQCAFILNTDKNAQLDVAYEESNEYIFRNAQEATTEQKVKKLMQQRDWIDNSTLEEETQNEHNISDLIKNHDIDDDMPFIKNSFNVSSSSNASIAPSNLINPYNIVSEMFPTAKQRTLKQNVYRAQLAKMADQIDFSFKEAVQAGLTLPLPIDSSSFDAFGSGDEVLAATQPDLVIVLSPPAGIDWSAPIRGCASVEEYWIIGPQDSEVSGALKETWGCPRLFEREIVDPPEFERQGFVKSELEAVSQHVLCTLDAPSNYGFGGASKFQRWQEDPS